MNLPFSDGVPLLKFQKKNQERLFFSVTTNRNFQVAICYWRLHNMCMITNPTKQRLIKLWIDFCKPSPLCNTRTQHFACYYCLEFFLQYLICEYLFFVWHSVFLKIDSKNSMKLASLHFLMCRQTLEIFIDPFRSGCHGCFGDGLILLLIITLTRRFV